jgi:hypothetical protein
VAITGKIEGYPYQLPGTVATRGPPGLADAGAAPLRWATVVTAGSGVTVWGLVVVVVEVVDGGGRARGGGRDRGTARWRDEDPQPANAVPATISAATTQRVAIPNGMRRLIGTSNTFSPEPDLILGRRARTRRGPGAVDDGSAVGGDSGKCNHAAYLGMTNSKRRHLWDVRSRSFLPSVSV